MRTTLLTAMVAALAVTAVASDASARSRHRSYAVAEGYGGSSLPLTVNRRSWLDPGPAVQHGSGPAYMSATTQFARTQDHIFGGDRYGNDVIQGQPYVPGRSVPVVEFSTLPDGGVEVDNTISAQNYYFNPAPSLPAVDYRQTEYVPY